MPRIRLSPNLFGAVEIVRLIEASIGEDIDIDLDTPFELLGYETFDPDIDPIKMAVLDRHSRAIDAAFTTGLLYGLLQSETFGLGNLTDAEAKRKAIAHHTGIDTRLDLDALLAPLGRGADLRPVKRDILARHEHAIEMALDAGGALGAMPWKLLFEDVDDAGAGQ